MTNNFYKKIESEIDDYLNSSVEISEGVKFSQNKLIKRIYLFKNKTYPKGKVDKQGKYKFWYDIIGPRMNSEVKNLSIDTKNPLIFSQNPIKDFGAVLITNMFLKDYLWKTGKAEEFNDATESFSGEGNLLMKKIKKGYNVCDPLNTYIINQTAKTIDETPVIERFLLTQSELREKAGAWENIEEVITNCGNKQFSVTKKTTAKETQNPYYEIFERNGEITEKELFELKGKEGGREDKYVLGRVIVAGLTTKKGSNQTEYVLFADELKGKKMSDVFIEAHRGAYNGRWWREGMYELLFDYQIRANEIGNQLSRGLEWASKVIFKSADNKTIQNVITDINNGDIIDSKDLAQVDVRMRGLDQLIADWNRLIQDADRVSNSFEIVTGEEMKGNVPFRLGLLMDTNVNKLFYFLRQKLGIAYNKIFKEWILPELIKEMKGEDIIRITGDSAFIDRFRKMAVENWYVKNLAKIGPHTNESAIILKEAKYEELVKVDPYAKNVKEIWDGILPRLWISITGENTDFEDEYQTISSLLQFETDPIRRAYLLDRVYAMKGLPVPPPVQQDIPQVTQSGKGKQLDDKKGVSEFETVQTTP